MRIGWRKMGVILATTFVMNASLADTFTPSHSCVKPYKPIEFSSRAEYEMFMGEVESYKSCISDFVEEQQEAIQRHRQAAEEAIEEWNSFVNFELN